MQALIRAGASAEEVAQRAGWPVEKVRRYEGPILAEREYVASLARGARLRGRPGSGAAGGVGALATRVAERLADRGVDAELVTWDAWRAEEGPWTVVVTFAAGGRQRSASWHFDTVDRVVAPVDDEARWLGEDQPRPSGPLPSAPRSAPGAPDAPSRRVYDVEAEGGVKDQGAPAGPVDLMTAMRQRSGARGRRSVPPMPGRGLREGAPAERLPGDLDEELPLENLPAPTPESHEPVGERPADPTRAPEPVGDGAGGEAARGDDPASAGDAAAADPEAGAGEVALPAKVAPDEVAVSESAAPVQAAAEPAAPMQAPPEAAAEPAAPAQPVAARPGEAGRRRPGRRSGRPSVPSWDDIMFGTRQGSKGESSDADAGR